MHFYEVILFLFECPFTVKRKEMTFSVFLGPKPKFIEGKEKRKM